VKNFLSLHDGAALLGEAVVLENLLFTHFGALSQQVTNPEVAVGFSVASRRHGVLAEIFTERLPVSASIPREPFLVLSSPLGLQIAAVLEHLPSDDLGALAFCCTELLPLHIERYEDHFGATTPTADGPARAALHDAVAVAEDDLDAFAALARRLND
jgi:hypothetical protein